MIEWDKNDPLAKDYIIVDKGGSWHLLCKHCDEAWSVAKDKMGNAGNVLFLLNHARSHEE